MIARSEIKPFRNVIKRYWTEDEVSIFCVKYLYVGQAAPPACGPVRGMYHHRLYSS